MIETNSVTIKEPMILVYAKDENVVVSFQDGAVFISLVERDAIQVAKAMLTVAENIRARRSIEEEPSGDDTATAPTDTSA